MACSLCQKNPNAHSFINFGRKDDIAYWYSSPAAAEEKINTLETLEYLKLHLEEAKQDPQWIWVFDCTNMNTQNQTSISVIRGIVRSLSDEHADILKEFWIINANMWIRGLITLFSPFVNKRLIGKLVFVPNTGVEFISKLTGVSITSFPWKK